MNQPTTFAQRLLLPLKSMVRRVIHHTDNPNLVFRDDKHLSQEYLRDLTAPDTAIHEIVRMLLKDIYFGHAVEELSGQYVIRAGFVGDELRANIYRLERFPGGPLSPVYNDTWRSEGIVSILLETDGTNHKAEALIQPYHTDLSYDYYEPCISYLKELSAEELALIAPITARRWRQAA